MTFGRVNAIDVCLFPNPPVPEAARTAPAAIVPMIDFFIIDTGAGLNA
jgi:hypothetical protein